MAEYTEREALELKLKSELDRWIDSAKEYKEERSGVTAMKEALYTVSHAPTADVVEVVHGRWEKRGSHDWGCSVCKIGVPYDRTGDHYCHNCGARMDG